MLAILFKGKKKDASNTNGLQTLIFNFLEDLGTKTDP